jgi:hypothetical protein
MNCIRLMKPFCKLPNYDIYVSTHSRGDQSVDTFLQRSDFSLVTEAICGLLPNWVLSILLKTLPNKTISQVQNYTRIARRVAKSLVDRQLDSDIKGTDSCQNILSRLGEDYPWNVSPIAQFAPVWVVNANLSAISSNKLSNDELLAQLT